MLRRLLPRLRLTTNTRPRQLRRKPLTTRAPAAPQRLVSLLIRNQTPPFPPLELRLSRRSLTPRRTYQTRQKPPHRLRRLQLARPPNTPQTRPP